MLNQVKNSPSLLGGTSLLTLLIMLMGACSDKPSAPREATKIPASPTAIVPSTISPAPSATMTLDTSGLTQSCAALGSNQTSKADLPGVLAITQDGAYLFEPSTGKVNNISSSSGIVPYGPISPDRTRLAALGKDGSVAILDGLGHVSALVPNPYGDLQPIQWLDNQTIALEDTSSQNPNGLDTIVVYHLTTKTSEEFIPDFPGIDTTAAGLLGHPAGQSRFVISPTEDHLVYFADQDYADAPTQPYNDSPPSLVMWDFANSTEVGRVKQYQFDAGIMGGRPIWANDGSWAITSAPIRFSIKEGPVGRTGSRTFVAIPESDPSEASYININDSYPYVGGNDLVVFMADGSIQRVTRLTSAYQTTEMDWQLSPDQKSVAFWLGMTPDDLRGSLAVASLLTGEVVDFCLPRGDQGDFTWAPDSTHLAVTMDPSKTSMSGIYALDVSSGDLTKLLDSGTSLAWLKIPDN